MAENSAIEWADSTFNPWIGCTKVGPGCDHCYAEALMDKRYGKAKWGAGHSRVRTSPANWKKPLQWNAQPFFQCIHCGWRGAAPSHGKCPSCPWPEAGFTNLAPTRRRVFCASLADVFDNEVDDAWRTDLWALIDSTRNLDWLLLTKRIGNAVNMLPAKWLTKLPDHIWLGATVVNQEEADRDIPKLLAVPARVRFLSIEPMLGPITLRNLPIGAWHDELHMPPEHERFDALHPHAPWQLDGVIVGGESGHHARPMHPDWVRSLRDQCQAAGVPFLFKQWGEWAPHRAVAGGDEGGDLRRGHVRYLQGDGREPDGHFRKGDAAVARVGKKAAGRTLDGRTWDQFP